ncbi:VPS28 protein-domain-containing protein, partial [Blyttiomyces helicus]
QEIRLYTTNKDREKYDHIADLYGIIVATEHLERAYIRDAVSAQEYTPACLKLIAQFKTALNLIGDSVPDVHAFMREYKLSCPAASKRLLEIGVPATVEHATTDTTSSGTSAKYVAETVQIFITLMDSLKLNYVAVDQIHPQLADLIQSLNKIPSLPADYTGKAKIRDWCVGAGEGAGRYFGNPGALRHELSIH